MNSLWDYYDYCVYYDVNRDAFIKGISGKVEVYRIHDVLNAFTYGDELIRRYKIARSSVLIIPYMPDENETYDYTLGQLVYADAVPHTEVFAEVEEDWDSVKTKC